MEIGHSVSRLGSLRATPGEPLFLTAPIVIVRQGFDKEKTEVGVGFQPEPDSLN